MEFEKNIIYIDSRESKNRIYGFIKYVENNLNYLNDSKASGLKPIYEKIKNGEKWYEITKLEFGDFIYNDVIFEYKTEDDWIDSSRRDDGGSTRLNRQLDECNRFAAQNKVCTVLEGDINKVQREFLTRMSFKTGLIIDPEQWSCFRNMLYVMKKQDNILYPPSRNFKPVNYPFGVGVLLSLGYPLNQAKAITRKYFFKDINDIIEVFQQDFDSFKEESKVKYLRKDVYKQAQRWLGL